MWDHIINIYLSELLNTKTKESIKKKKKKLFHNNLKKMDNFNFISNNILINFFKTLTKYKNDYQ